MPHHHDALVVENRPGCILRLLMQAGYPDVAVLPGRFDWAMLCTVIMTSFLGQVLLNRAFQISNASKASSINCVQVRPPTLPGTC